MTTLPFALHAAVGARQLVFLGVPGAAPPAAVRAGEGAVVALRLVHLRGVGCISVAHVIRLVGSHTTHERFHSLSHIGS